MEVISVIIPVYNGEKYLDECFNSIAQQMVPSDSPFGVQISIYDDGSTDKTIDIINKWSNNFMERGFEYKFKTNCGPPRGVGYARNQAIENSTGEYLCFCDADDIMEPERLHLQYLAAKNRPDALVGSLFRRIPEGSTPILVKWANSLSQDQLHTQIYMSFGPSIAMPTWFCRRDVYTKVSGGFDERGKGIPEDLIFFYQHLNQNGSLHLVSKILMTYRFHSDATTFSVSEHCIWKIRLERLERKVLSQWTKFTIWNAGKLGRKFFRSLSAESTKKVSAFCDIDEKKISQGTFHPYPMNMRIPIVHVKDASPPFIICVKTVKKFTYRFSHY